MRVLLHLLVEECDIPGEKTPNILVIRKIK